jgi:hypothetical protein
MIYFGLFSMRLFLSHDLGYEFGGSARIDLSC